MMFNHSEFHIRIIVSPLVVFIHRDVYRSNLCREVGDVTFIVLFLDAVIVGILDVETPLKPEVSTIYINHSAGVH